MDVKAQVISGNYAEILCRQKHGAELELGELLIAETKNGRILFQIYDLKYASQISQQNLELISGMRLEHDIHDELLEPELRNYVLASCKAILQINGNNAKIAKALPPFFTGLRSITKEDLKFLAETKNSLDMGVLRSGSKKLDVPIMLDASKVFSHHILISIVAKRIDAVR